MQYFSQMIKLSEELTNEYEKYLTKATKAGTKRMRATLNEMKKLATPAKSDLMDADKAE